MGGKTGALNEEYAVVLHDIAKDRQVIVKRVFGEFIEVGIRRDDIIAVFVCKKRSKLPPWEMYGFRRGHGIFAEQERKLDVVANHDGLIFYCRDRQVSKLMTEEKSIDHRLQHVETLASFDLIV